MNTVFHSALAATGPLTGRLVTSCLGSALHPSYYESPAKSKDDSAKCQKRNSSSYSHRANTPRTKGISPPTSMCLISSAVLVPRGVPGLISLQKGKGRSQWCLQRPDKRRHRRGIQTLLGFAQRWDKTQWPPVAVMEISVSCEESFPS